MTEREAHEKGYAFTGMCWSIYDNSSSHSEQYKAEARKIKKTYEGADYVIVTGNKGSWLGSSSKGIYGNEIFNKVKDYDEERALAYMHSYCDRVEKAKQEYEATLKKLSDDLDEAIRKYNYIQSLKTKK